LEGDDIEVVVVVGEDAGEKEPVIAKWCGCR
jgi:hypothetical protein